MFKLKYQIGKTGILWFIAEKEGTVIKCLTLESLIKKLKVL